MSLSTQSIFNNNKFSNSSLLFNQPLCRICQTNYNSNNNNNNNTLSHQTTTENLISPCNCKGTLAFMHLSCLERWLNQSGRQCCELCGYQYNAIEQRRFGLWASLIYWIFHPMHRRYIGTDIIIILLLTLVTTVLFAICLNGMEYFIKESKKIGIDGNAMKILITGFLVIIGFAYLISMYLLFKDNLMPWYQWWQRTVNIRLQETNVSSV